MLGLKLNHVSKRGYRWLSFIHSLSTHTQITWRIAKWCIYNYVPLVHTVGCAGNNLKGHVYCQIRMNRTLSYAQITVHDCVLWAAWWIYGIGMLSSLLIIREGNPLAEPNKSQWFGSVIFSLLWPEELVRLPVIWVTMTLMWPHDNGYHWSVYLLSHRSRVKQWYIYPFIIV